MPLLHLPSSKCILTNSIQRWNVSSRYPSLPVIKRQTCPATLWNTNTNYTYRQMTRNHPLTNSKNIYPPILPRFLPSISFADHLVPRRVAGRGCFLSSLQLWRLSVPEFFQDAFSCEYLDHAKSSFKRRIVSLMLDQKLMLVLLVRRRGCQLRREQVVKEQLSWIFMHDIRRKIVCKEDDIKGLYWTTLKRDKSRSWTMSN